MTTAAMPLFIYGILCAPQFLATLLQEPNETALNVAARITRMLQAVTVKGYEQRSKYFGGGYALGPAAIASEDPEAKIQGFLLTLASTSPRRKLDNFEGEGEAYKSVPVQIYVTISNQLVSADMHLWNGSMGKISLDPWDLAAIMRNGL
ncbi:hypothetical protein QBC36DRAFT_300258 [Triangularia setosa]|uniref:Putative gamma-glutamylcyclotransferase n=1 Tax=Triangularia setosa TaxID=2587417 RepID=A0AAN6W9E3_9PEZI|nr:hypothetical protein QBC36DRAFT_300258 [Podospora setosa]